ncbi:unnamed protein product [Didymodactylos carnosus]|uniref:UBX domain-containing protein n=1 Tax=Didymodactylos carnosus TaxID=1234261 RepID=A0A814V673_9BILA|nr:unnamed protein product [Didymodactylos carnosus]CAF1183913.1 unnamed protein product [Didymodactylos carnosus]CAF3737269.1 unnamed protein product [Didymodactylos carnosus]CAF3948215.1 unnamed protein product [Didymodactylos carnosus]
MSSSPLISQLEEMGFSIQQAESAVNIGKSNNLEQAIDWIVAHGEETTSEQQQQQPVLTLNDSTTNNATASSTTTEQKPEANSLKCDECGKLLKDADAATFHATKTNHSSFSECTETVKPLTDEEREEMKKKLSERIKMRRAEIAKQEEEKELDRERKRINDGKELGKIKAKKEEDDMKKLAAERKREKEEARLAKERVIEQIARDRADKAAKAKAEQSGNLVEEKPRPEHFATPPVHKSYDECTIQIRLPDGSSVRENFKVTDKFDKVLEWLKDIRKSSTTRPFMLFQTFPKKEYQDTDRYKTLEDLQLVPSSSLHLKELTQFQT